MGLFSPFRGSDGGEQALSPGTPGEASGSAFILCVFRLWAWIGCLGQNAKRLYATLYNTQGATAWKGKVSANFTLFCDCPERWGLAASGAREEPPLPSSPFQLALVLLALLCISWGSRCCCLLLPGDNSALSIWRWQHEQMQKTLSPPFPVPAPAFQHLVVPSSQRPPAFSLLRCHEACSSLAQ